MATRYKEGWRSSQYLSRGLLPPVVTREYIEPNLFSGARALPWLWWHWWKIYG
jgi:hypothetical protein